MKPDISIIIPVLNEPATIRAVLECLADQSTGEKIEIIVVDADPDAKTLRAIDFKMSSQLLLKTEISDKGRSIQMNRGAELAVGAILLFLHADTLLPEGAIDAVLSALQNPHIVGGAFDLGIRSSKWGYRIIENVASARSRITRLPYGDQAVFLRRDYFHMIGGFSMIPIMEDVDIMQRIKKRGDAIKIIDKKVQTDPRRWEKEGLVFGTFRNWVLMMLYLLGVSPHKLVRYYKIGFEDSRGQGSEGKPIH
ncbi:MAG: glycosyl transferase family 2 [Deltaproteobacteria bacterium]|nr:MAG: glycosyl transferase family 2 [Deltaproteobacteria bacterium]RLC13244.1 MAG: glycosyl transferase family 2 [Deltaproteobacteria bacterium]